MTRTAASVTTTGSAKTLTAFWVGKIPVAKETASAITASTSYQSFPPTNITRDAAMTVRR